MWNCSRSLSQLQLYFPLFAAQRYAVWAAPRVGFSLRRAGEARADLATSPGASRLDVIRQLHGPDLAGALLPFKLALGGEPGPDIAADAPDGPHMRVEGFVSSLAWAGRRSVLTLFINGRCVECGPLKRGAEAVYSTLVPRGPKPWMFLDVRLPPRQVEVNVHPTKREVGFLNQVSARVRVGLHPRVRMCACACTAPPPCMAAVTTCLDHG